MVLEHLLFFQAALKKEYSATLNDPYIWKHFSSLLFDTSPLKCFHPIRFIVRTWTAPTPFCHENAKTFQVDQSCLTNSELFLSSTSIRSHASLKCPAWGCCPPLPCWPTEGGIHFELAGVICYWGGVVKHSDDVSASFLCFHLGFFFFSSMHISCFSFWHHDMYRLEIGPCLQTFRAERLPPGLKSRCCAEENIQQTFFTLEIG